MNSFAKEKSREMYEALPKHLTSDLVEAAVWARDTLTNHEGSGHHFELHALVDGTLICSFAKSSWGGDHEGSPMPSGAEAICIAVCEYLSGC